MNIEVRVVIMDSKLELFLNKINLPKEDYNYFNEGKILKIKSTKDKLNWDFIIETKENKKEKFNLLFFPYFYLE